MYEVHRTLGRRLRSFSLRRRLSAAGAVEAIGALIAANLPGDRAAVAPELAGDGGRRLHQVRDDGFTKAQIEATLSTLVSARGGRSLATRIWSSGRAAPTFKGGRNIDQ